MAELEEVSRDPKVRKFTELRQKIGGADAHIDESILQPASDRSSSPFHPYDAYDAFEFARDISGQEVSTLQLSKLAYDRFPEWSDESRRFMMHYLIENGVAKAAGNRAVPGQIPKGNIQNDTLIVREQASLMRASDLAWQTPSSRSASSVSSRPSAVSSD